MGANVDSWPYRDLQQLKAPTLFLGGFKLLLN
ncbi:hypothetical protein AEAC466_15515 [Asticcacaulis sp. AC466]|nr:hypothetical protein AEAC466_15515 [Asticcacaulis sp. AC466]